MGGEVVTATFHREREPSADSLRPVLFAIAYRMLGSAADAEDVVQSSYVRYLDYTRSGREVDSPRALLTTIATRLAIDHLRSARVQREAYLGPWLPEPLVTSTDNDPAEAAVMSDSLSMAFLVVLETLTPVQRAVFLLREVFGCDYAEVARVVGRTETNCRQLLARARARVEMGRTKFDVDPVQRAALAGSFLNAAERGDVDDLAQLLAADVVAYGDGAGKGHGLLEPVCGRPAVLQVFQSIIERYRALDASFERAEINGRPGMLAFDPESRLINVVVIDADHGLISDIYSVLNPDKLRHLGFPLSTRVHGDAASTGQRPGGTTRPSL